MGPIDNRCSRADAQRPQAGIAVHIGQLIAVLLMAVLAVPGSSVLGQDFTGSSAFQDARSTQPVLPIDNGWHHVYELERRAVQENIERFWKVASGEHLTKADLVQRAILASANLPGDFIDDLVLASEWTGVPFPEILAFNLFSSELSQIDECTVFAAAGAASLTGDTLNSKNRDLNDSYIQVLVMVTPTNGYAYMGVSTAGQAGVAMGINEMGVSITDTSMMVPAFDETGYSTFTVMDHVLKHSADVETAISVIDTMAKRTGATYVVADKDKAAIVEAVPTIYTPDISYVIVRDSVAYHTNHYLLEPFRSWVSNGSFGTVHPSSYARYDRATELVRSTNGPISSITLADYLRDLKNFGVSKWGEVIRAHPEVPTNIWAPGSSDYSIDNIRTASSSIFESDRQDPGMLSTMWMSIGNPSFSPFIPIHNAVLGDPVNMMQQLEPYSDGTASTCSRALEVTMNAHWGSFNEHFREFEQRTSQDVASAEYRAEALVDSQLVIQARSVLEGADAKTALDGLGLYQHQIANQIRLSAGWNQVAVPLLNDTLSPSALGLSTGSQVVEWNASSQCVARAYSEGVPNESVDFNLVLGHSYWIFSPSTQTVDFLGYSPDMIHQYDLILSVPTGGGWADIGFETVGPGFLASEIQSMVFEASVRAVCQLNPILEEYSFYAVGFGPSSSDFAIEPGEGAFVWVDGPGILVFLP